MKFARAGGSTAALRVANQRRVIDALRTGDSEASITQADIARTAGLAPATVSNIVRELVVAGVVETVSGPGRGTAVRISRQAGLIAGLDIGHRHLRVAIGDLGGSVLIEHRLPLAPDHPYEQGLDMAEEMFEKLLGELSASPADVLAIGLGLPAPIDAAGLVAAASILPGWVGVDARAVASERFGCPVHLDNDANLGALAEHRLGAGAGHDCMVYLKVSSGVGAGLILDGRLFHGGGGTAGEIGHLTVDSNGPICRCGSRGCLEAYTSVGAVGDMLSQRHPDASMAELVAAACDGDIAVRRAFEDAGSHLGWGVAMLANLINPSTLVIGGDMAQAGEFLLESVQAGVRRHALASVSSTLTMSVSSLGDRSGVIGALLLALDHTELALPAAAS
ncbi:MAG: ROK family transcriptional regulator [Geodermatophilaceae bacterium]|nr:ROK family transcriptional regulator [Geodermatophilaceae bacterium]